jgi:hypothetical protein
MAAFGRYKLADALPQPQRKPGGKRGGKHKSSQVDIAEQTREAAESRKARGTQASNRERMVDIGRGNQQAGRQGS